MSNITSGESIPINGSSESINIDQMNAEDRAFYEQCLSQIGLTISDVANENASHSTTVASTLALWTTQSGSGNVTTLEELADNDSPISACLTILNFKKNPHMVLSQTTIYTIILVYR